MSRATRDANGVPSSTQDFSRNPQFWASRAPPVVAHLATADKVFDPVNAWA
jgi:hypothetical protein